MKKLFYFAMALGLVACQAEKVDVNGAVETEANYLSVNIKAANGFTRAYNDKDGYEDGTLSKESDVELIRFYFFDENGAAVPVTVTGASYSDFNVTADGFGEAGKDMDNSIEHKLQATVILHKTIENGDKSGLPAQLVAVLNPNTAELSKLGNPSLTELTTAVVNGLAINTTATGKTFVMTNSVYTEDGEESLNAVEISDENLASTPEAAVLNPVTVYVERVVAKLSVEIGTGDNLTPVDDLENVFDTGVTYGLGANKKSVYVELLGWNVTATADQSFLVKNINPAWAGAVEDITDATGLFKTVDEPWNYAAFHRSYWAYNPNDVTLQYGTFNGKENFPSESEKDEDNVNPALTHEVFANTEVAYLPENAGKGSAEAEAANADPSQVILAAQLVDEDGDPLPLAEFMGLKFVDKTETFEEVKKAILAAFPYEYYKHDTENDTYYQLSAADIDIKTAWEVAGAENMPESGRYLVYAQLKDRNVEWYTVEGKIEDGKLTEGTTNAVDEDIDAQLKETGAAKIWNEGKTYYYFDIRHLANPTFTETGEALATAKKNAPGYYGVVRNHVYRTTITGLTGLGTPVFNPNEIIIPEKPNEEEVFLAAEINILAWRIVNQNVELNW